jgi:exonuclease VII small subunit
MIKSANRLLAGPGAGQFVEALAGLTGPGVMKRFPPVQAQAARLDAHLAARSGEHARAAEAWERAESLARACGLAFETAVFALERGEHGADRDDAALAGAEKTFQRLGAAPWLARALDLRARMAARGTT